MADTRRADLKLDALVDIKINFDRMKQEKAPKTVLNNKAKKLARKYEVNQKTIQRLFCNRDGLIKRIDLEEQLRTLIVFEQLLCWPVDPFLKLMRMAMKDLYKVEIGRGKPSRLCSLETCQNRIYSLYAYNLKIGIRDYRRNIDIRKRMKDNLKLWDSGTFSIFAIPVIWTKESVNEENKTKYESNKSLLIIVADRNNPIGNIGLKILKESNFSQKNLPDEVSEILAEIGRDKGEVKLLQIVNIIENENISPLINNVDPFRKHWGKVSFDEPTSIEGPLIFHKPLPSEESLHNKLLSIIKRIGTLNPKPPPKKLFFAAYAGNYIPPKPPLLYVLVVLAITRFGSC